MLTEPAGVSLIWFIKKHSVSRTMPQIFTSAGLVLIKAVQPWYIVGKTSVSAVPSEKKHCYAWRSSHHELCLTDACSVPCTMRERKSKSHWENQSANTEQGNLFRSGKDLTPSLNLWISSTEYEGNSGNWDKHHSYSHGTYKKVGKIDIKTAILKCPDG